MRGSKRLRDHVAGRHSTPLLHRRSFLAGVAGSAAAAIGTRPRRASAQSALSGEVAFATFEWNTPHTGSVLRALTQSFNQRYPNVRIREIPIPAGGYHDQILTQLTAGTPPDIFRIDDPQLPLYMERGFLTPLDDAIREAGVDTARFAPAMRDARHEGKTYGVVYQTNTRQLIFNRALLQAAGIDGPPRDAAQLEDQIRRTTKRDQGQFGFTFASKAGDATALFLSAGPLIIGFGSHFTTDDGRPNATDPRLAEALGFLKRIWDADCVPRGLDGPAANSLIFSGRVALTLNGSFVFGAATPETRPNLAAVASPLPSTKLMRGTSWYGVGARGRNKDAAIAWLMHMLTPESQAKIVEVERVTPALPHLIPARFFEESPWLRPFVEGASTAVSYLPPGLGSRAFSQIRTIGDEIEAILYRNKPIPTAMADLQRALEAGLRR